MVGSVQREHANLRQAFRDGERVFGTRDDSLPNVIRSNRHLHRHLHRGGSVIGVEHAIAPRFRRAGEETARGVQRGGVRVFREHDVSESTGGGGAGAHQPRMEFLGHALGPPARGAVESKLNGPRAGPLRVRDVHPEIFPRSRVNHRDVRLVDEIVLGERPP